MREPEMKLIAGFIARALRGRNDDAKVAGVRAEVAELCARFPAYPHGA
jgi:glycine/serine hydroxymethyltransferase